ncbi:hypothetical protein CSUI_005090 [Cystoisospora suis]|uniref:CRAL-TRIO domain-containing protein n=1 Tax=Cystoisospora suis TaxID=483139 RepID=A0A2C6KZ74_9APIC|nr:hypothetical protein CSUI_005090 [Cystoisospora suis]
MEGHKRAPNMRMETWAFCCLPGVCARARHRERLSYFPACRATASGWKFASPLLLPLDRCDVSRRPGGQLRVTVLRHFLLLLLVFAVVPECQERKQESAQRSGAPWLEVLAAPEGVSLAVSGSSFALGGNHDSASIATPSPPVLPFSDDDLKMIARGFERHLQLYPACIHGRSKKGSVVIYRRLPTESANESYVPSRDLLVDAFLLQKVVQQTCAQGEKGGEEGPCRFLLVIDLENIASFIRSALTPVGVATLHKQPQSQVLAFVNSPQWQYLRSLFFIPAYCENVILLNAPPIVLQLLSILDHFLFHPHRNPVTGRGHPDSARLIQAAVAQNKGGRFLLQGSLDTSALLDVVDQSQLPVEYLQQSQENEEGEISIDVRKSVGMGGLIESTPETVSLFKSLFQLTLQIEGSLELAKERNPTLASVAMVKGGKNDAFAALHDLRSRSPVSASSKSREKKAERKDVETESTRKNPVGIMQSEWGFEMIPPFVGDRTEFGGNGDSGYHQEQQQQQAKTLTSAAEQKKVHEGGSKKPGAGSAKRKRSGVLGSAVVATGQQTSAPSGDTSATHEQQHVSLKRDDRGKKGGVSTATVLVDEGDVSLESKKHVRKGGVGKETMTSPPSKKKRRKRSSVAGTSTTTTTGSPTTSSRTPPKGGAGAKKRVAGRTKSSRSPRSLDAQPAEVPVSPTLSTPPPSPVTVVTTSPPLPGVETESRVPPAPSGSAVAWGDSGLDAQEQQVGGVFLPLDGISAEVPTLGSEQVVGDVRKPSAGGALPAEHRSFSDGNEVTSESSLRVGEKLRGTRTDGSFATLTETESRSGYKEPEGGVFEMHSRDDFSEKEIQGFESATAATIEGSMFSVGPGLTAAGAGQGGAWGSVNFSGSGGGGLGWGPASAEGWGASATVMVEPKKKPDIERGYYLDEEEALQVADDFDDI